MASNAKARKRPFVRALPVIVKVVALCAVALVALLLLLPAPPERRAGGVTTVAKHVPTLRDTMNPLGKRPDEAERQTPRTVIAPPAPAQPQQPLIVMPPEQDTTAPPDPARKPDSAAGEAPPDLPPAPGSLPWTGEGQVANVPDTAPQAVPPQDPSGLPGRSDIQDWLKSQAWEFLGGVDKQGNILYRFEVWLAAPASVLEGIKTVSYVYDAPSATPGERDSEDAKTGFRARFGSLACAKKVTVTLTMSDGRTQQAVADGCRALN